MRFGQVCTRSCGQDTVRRARDQGSARGPDAVVTKAVVVGFGRSEGCARGLSRGALAAKVAHAVAGAPGQA